MTIKFFQIMMNCFHLDEKDRWDFERLREEFDSFDDRVYHYASVNQFMDEHGMVSGQIL